MSSSSQQSLILNENVILCRVPKHARDHFLTCPFCFYEDQCTENQIYHAKHDCPFAKNLCQEVNCSCPKFFCWDCDYVFLTLFELKYHKKHTCIVAPFSENYCGKFVVLNGMFETEICSCLTPEIQKEKRFNCNECLEQFASAFEKENHSFNCKYKRDYELLLTEFEKLRLDDDSENKKEHLKFKCDYCKVIFDNRELYKNHDCNHNENQNESF